jgi:nucleotide-binding universal stress UspA family protein
MPYATSYATLMVHLGLGHSNAGPLQVAGDLAQRFQAGLIGIAACQPLAYVYGDGYVDGALVEAGRKELERELREAEAEFRQACGHRTSRLEWRGALDSAPLDDHIARQARSADLIVTGAAASARFDSARSVDLGALVMQAGRPVLVVPATVRALPNWRAVIAWKDTREARRAVVDALPLLQAATAVTVVEIAGEREMAASKQRLAGVVDWLARHGISAQPLTAPATDDDAGALYAQALDLGANLIVAGAYGHSRLREWALGGVTRDLLLHEDCCALLSH